MIIHQQCKTLYTVIQLQLIIYNKFIKFYDNYFKNYINDKLWLDNNVQVFYTINIWPLNSYLFVNILVLISYPTHFCLSMNLLKPSFESVSKLLVSLENTPLLRFVNLKQAFFVQHLFIDIRCRLFWIVLF